MRRYLASLWVLASVAVASAQTPNMPVGPGSGGGGGGGGGGSGVSSLAAGCQATVVPLTGAVTVSTKFSLSANSPVVTTPYAINGTSDPCNLILLNSGASVLTLGSAATTGFGKDTYWAIDNQTGGAATLNITTSTLDGLSTVPIPSGQTIAFQSDGTNYHYTQAPGTNLPLPVAAASGGTGVANTGGKTFTFGASFTTTGAGAPTLAFPAGSQTYTFPNASSTIVDLSSTQALTGKTIDGSAIGSTTPANGAFTALSATGQITSTATTGTAPLVIASTTNVPNLNASSLSGATFAAPGAIGGGTASAGTFTVLKGTTSTATAVIGPSGADSTTAFQITKADLATRIVDVDTTNARVGINKTPGAFDLDVNGAANFGSTIAATGAISTSSSFSQTSSNTTAFSALSARNTNAGAAAATVFNFGNSTSASEVSMTLNGGSFTATPNQFTINSAGNMFLSGGGVQSARIDTAGDFSLMRSFTVAGLPTCNAGKQGALGYVTDATTPTYNGALVGGGAVIVPVFCNGSAWTSH